MNLGSRLQRPCSEFTCSFLSNSKEGIIIFTRGAGRKVNKSFIEETLELSLER